MSCCVSEMRNKEVINVFDGKRLGFVCDVEVDICDARIISIIVPGECDRFFSRSENIKIPWACIQHIGEDIIIVNVKDLSHCCVCEDKKRRGKLW